MMHPTDVPVIQPGVVLEEDFDDWAVLFYPLTGEAVGLDPVGQTIWKLIDGQRTLAEIAAQVESLCEGVPDPKTILEDTLAFINDLERKLMVRKKDEEQDR
jgi:hypothetical protein